MEYAESLLTEYFEVSSRLTENGGPESQPKLLLELLSLEEEICFEYSLPASQKNRNIFRIIKKGETQILYVTRSMETLQTERTRYFFKPERNFWDAVRAA
jgi:hypothetical protein